MTSLDVSAFWALWDGTRWTRSISMVSGTKSPKIWQKNFWVIETNSDVGMFAYPVCPSDPYWGLGLLSLLLIQSLCSVVPLVSPHWPPIDPNRLGPVSMDPVCQSPLLGFPHWGLGGPAPWPSPPLRFSLGPVRHLENLVQGLSSPYPLQEISYRALRDHFPPHGC